MRGFVGTQGRMRTELWASLAILAGVAVLPAIMTNDYWRGVIVVSMYFALLAIGWNLPDTRDNSRWHPPPSE